MSKADLEMVNTASVSPTGKPELAQALHSVVEKKVQSYDPSVTGNESEFSSGEKTSMWVLLTKYSTRGDMCMFFTALISAGLFGMTLPLFMILWGGMVDSVGQTAGDTDTGFSALTNQSILMIYMAVGVFFVSTAQVCCFKIFSENISFRIKIMYFKFILDKDATWFDSNNPAEMSAKIAGQTAAIERGAGEKIGAVFQAVTGTISGFTFAFAWGWELALILCAATPLLGAVGAWLGMVMKNGVSAQMKAYSQSSGYAEQALSSIKVVHTYGQEVLETQNYNKYLEFTKKIGKQQVFSNSLMGACLYFIMFGFYGYAFYFGGKLRAQGNEDYTGGAVISILFSTIMGVFQLGGAGGHVKAISEAQVAGKLAFEVMDHKPKIIADDSSAKKLKRDEIKGHIEFKNVTFKYPSRDDLIVLKNFSCVFEQGKTTALVGPSGSGKSTIIQLLERFYDPESGSVELDGQDYKGLHLKTLRQNIGYVGQEPVLFNTTIRENMYFAKPDATDEEIKDALKAANAWDFIQTKMSETGIDTQVGATGGQLSGGQKQRIAIARAFLKKPKILLLDEATSALDKINEKAVQDAIDNYRKTSGDITIIIIAHRLSTIKDADKIVVLKSGELIEMGKHEELLKQYPNGTYAGFVKKQETAEQNVKETQQDTEADTKNLEDLVLKAGKDPAEVAMKEKVDAVDAEWQKKVDAENEKNTKKKAFNKLMEYNDPKILIFTGVIFSFLQGGNMPIIGIVLSKLLGIMTVPFEYLAIIDESWTGTGQEYLEHEVNWYSVLMVSIAFYAGICSLIQKMSFGHLGTNVTHTIRTILYDNIMQKNIGWFDHRENGTSVLTTAMAQDTTIINGVSTESLAPQVEGTCSLLAGIGIALFFCWQEALVCIAMSPVMTIGKSIGVKVMHKLSNDQNDLQKEANLLCGDVIVNYKTSQTFGHEDLLVKKYEELLSVPHNLTISAQIKAGVAFGISNLAQYVVFAGMFFFGGKIMENSMQADGTMSIKPENVFIALFAIMFGASHAGTATAFGPDMGKAQAAAERIFKIKDAPSQINAIEIDKDSSKIRLNLDEIKGKIEFREVWFRYPTRKEDFVLRGLNITINPSEQVALVGESGCGKSTFVNLMMRFYDVDSGTIFLDDIDIRKINLHDLRKAVSLVMQEPIIFNYTILENILYGKTEAFNTEVLKAAELANAMEFIEKNDTFTFDESATSLKNEMIKNKIALVDMIGVEKYDEELAILGKMEEQEKKRGEFHTQYGDVDKRENDKKDAQMVQGFQTACGIRGSKLSGGQKQRVAIARTIIRQPKVLMLDEATSALDEDSQQKVQKALNTAMQGRTTIVIAHRLSTIENCNKIFVLENGRVIEEGGFNELKQKGGFFAKLSKGKQN